MRKRVRVRSVDGLVKVDGMTVCRRVVVDGEVCVEFLGKRHSRRTNRHHREKVVIPLKSLTECLTEPE